MRTGEQTLACLALTLAPLTASAAKSDFTSVTVAGKNVLEEPGNWGNYEWSNDTNTLTLTGNIVGNININETPEVWADCNRPALPGLDFKTE